MKYIQSEMKVVRLNESIDMGDFTLQDLKDCLRRIDIKFRPYIIYCHPSDKELILSAIGDSHVIEDIPWMEPGKIIIMDRAKIEEEYENFFDGFVDYKEIGNESL